MLQNHDCRKRRQINIQMRSQSHIKYLMQKKKEMRETQKIDGEKKKSKYQRSRKRNKNFMIMFSGSCQVNKGSKMKTNEDEGKRKIEKPRKKKLFNELTQNMGKLKLGKPRSLSSLLQQSNPLRKVPEKKHEIYELAHMVRSHEKSKLFNEDIGYFKNLQRNIQNSGYEKTKKHFEKWHYEYKRMGTEMEITEDTKMPSLRSSQKQNERGFTENPYQLKKICFEWKKTYESSLKKLQKAQKYFIEQKKSNEVQKSLYIQQINKLQHELANKNLHEKQNSLKKIFNYKQEESGTQNTYENDKDE